MPVSLPSVTRDARIAAAAAEFACLAEQRQRLFALIGEFRQALAQPARLLEAVFILRAILPSARVYFALVESLLDKIAAEGAAPHRAVHHRILGEVSRALELACAPGATPSASDLSHALDSLVVHELAIHLRSER